VVFLLIEFPLRQQKSVSFIFRCALFFVDTYAHTYFLLLYFDMSQTLNYVTTFDGSNYGYWKARMRFFLKSIDCWNIVDSGWTKPEDATPENSPSEKHPTF